MTDLSSITVLPPRVDLDLARLLALGKFALELDMQQAVLERGAGDLDIFGKLEAQLEGALGNAAMQEFARLVLGLGRPCRP